MADFSIPPNVPLKKCTKCGIEKPATAEYFHRNNGNKSGLHPNCRICRAMARGRVPMDLRTRLDFKSCPDCKIIYPATLEYFYPDKKSKYGVSVLCILCTRSRVRQREIHNPGYAKQAKAVLLRRRARKRSLPDNFSTKDYNRMMEHWKHKCAYCGAGGKMQGDHFIALGDSSCPGTIPQNMIPACKSCNSSKYKHSPDKWLVRKYGKSKANEILQRIQNYFDQL